MHISKNSQLVYRRGEYRVMAVCGSKFVYGSSRKATVAESVFIG